MDHCSNEPDGKVKQIRYCDYPTPKFGGDLCPEPDNNERYISCNATNYQSNSNSLQIVFQLANILFYKNSENQYNIFGPKELAYTTVNSFSESIQVLKSNT